MKGELTKISKNAATNKFDTSKCWKSVSGAIRKYEITKASRALNSELEQLIQ